MLTDGYGRGLMRGREERLAGGRPQVGGRAKQDRQAEVEGKHALRGVRRWEGDARDGRKGVETEGMEREC